MMSSQVMKLDAVALQCFGPAGEAGTRLLLNTYFMAKTALYLVLLAGCGVLRVCCALSLWPPLRLALLIMLCYALQVRAHRMPSLARHAPAAA